MNRSHDSLLGPSRKGLTRLHRAAFNAVSKLEPRELLLLGMQHSPLNDEPATIKELLGNPQDSKRDRGKSYRGCFFVLSFTKARWHRRHALTGNFILPVRAAYLFIQRACTLFVTEHL